MQMKNREAREHNYDIKNTRKIKLKSSTNIKKKEKNKKKFQTRQSAAMISKYVAYFTDVEKLYLTEGF